MPVAARRRSALAELAAVSTDSTDLAFAGAAEQARLVRERSVSARDVVEAALAQIECYDETLRAFRVVFAERALADADEIDRTSSRADASVLLGVPVAIKDDTDVAGEITAWGSAAHGPAATTDAEVVIRLRRAGAIVIGKTNVPELNLWPWTASSAWGTTRNPWDTARTPGGSSGGSAVAVACGMCGVALGSDGGGSIRYPAALTGVFGFKPQRDVVPLGSLHDAWNGLLTYGTLTRSVRDAAVFLDATADVSPPLGYAAGLDGALPRLRVAVSYSSPPWSLAHLNDTQRRAIEDVAECLRSLGHTVTARDVDYGNALSNLTLRYLAGVARDAAGMAHPERLEARTRRLAAVGRRVPRRLVARARAGEAGIAARINRVFDDADVVVTPIAGGAAARVDDFDGAGALGSFRRSNVMAWASPWNVIGQPAASVPAGFDADGLPLAVQIAAPRGRDAMVLRVAAELERARPATARPPVPTRE